ncbi:methionine ABC transporter ATP-binding protein [Patulibacter sp.]|uniref:methionine ABC transporter ATP-binding protein n=1 Tax=Patulibacter sp. TaxID=1912859 RepID=UPI00271AA73F|nr:ATP-binding cassette domain-containing protein [Patulibacter sp.]MDO9408974.1 ATP-binding cassette domain-containing protein [Patulibacter sp.]
MILVDALTKSFRRDGRDVLVLDDVSLSVGTGRIAGVIGPSGAGKSTLARCINLLERPTSGTITVGEQELTSLDDRRLQAARRSIGTIFQSANLLSSRTVAGNVALPLEIAGVPRGERRERVAELVARVGLEDHARSYPAQLSGGQRQRVGIARALALRPSVLLSDEATSGLDPDTTRSILALLRGLRDDLGLTILLITHEMEVVRDVCDQVALLRDGRIVEQGDVASLVADPASALGRGLVPARPVGTTPTGAQAWRVTYTDRAVDPGWLAGLQDELGTRVALLGASVEAVGGRPSGHVTVALDDAGLDLAARLGDRGLFAERLGADDEAQPPSAVADLVAAPPTAAEDPGTPVTRPSTTAPSATDPAAGARTGESA